MKLISKGVAAIAFAALTLTSCGGGQPAVKTTDLPKSTSTITGAGASFPAPLVTAWADEYRNATKKRVTVNYQSIGSGGGIRQFMEQTIMFGASEAHLTDAQMAQALNASGGFAYNLPITLGDVVLTYNVPGVASGLVFNSQLIADIFLGNITLWNDAKILALNPGIKLPDMPIKIAHRSDGSGTTNVFTTYLSRVNKDWAEKVGFGTSVSWPVGTGGNGNEGVAGIVQSTPGALGYNSLVYATLNKISFGSVINKSGNTIVPSFAATSAAAAIEIPRDGRIMIVDTSAPKGYPIAGFSWTLVYQNLEANKSIATREDAIELIRFLLYVVTDGQKISEGLSFAPLPAEAQAVAVNMIKTLKYNGEDLGAKIVAAGAENWK